VVQHRFGGDRELAGHAVGNPAHRGTVGPAR
jgi:hypothetical protein